MLKEAKLFVNGQSQAVRLPKEFRFSGKSVYVNKLGNYVVLIPKNNPWDGMRAACDKFSDDFMESGEQGEFEEREALD